MKTQLSVISFLAFLITIPSFLYCYESAIAKDGDEIIVEKTYPSTSKTDLTEEEKIFLLRIQSQVSEETNRRARKFFIAYPYETSRLILFCQRKAHLKGGWLFNANGNGSISIRH